MSDKEQLQELYKDKILGVRNYKSDKKEFFVSDFISIEPLKDFLYEVDTGESDITPAGKTFLEKYYGIQHLAEILSAEGMNIDYAKEHGFDKWLTILEPMETIRFIEESRGTIQKGASMNPKLLPPEESH